MVDLDIESHLNYKAARTAIPISKIAADNMIIPAVKAPKSRVFSTNEEVEENLDKPQTSSKIEKKHTSKVAGLMKFPNRKRKSVNAL